MSEPAAVTDLILQTKIQPPRLRPRNVARPGLVARLEAAEWQKLTMVCAPAGFGKTTLLTLWARSSSSTFHWLFLDERDNVLERFLRYLVASLQQGSPQTGQNAREILAAPQPIQPEQVLAALINDLAEARSRHVLIIDDFHVINNPAVVAAVQYLLDHLPDALHLVIASRVDPSLAIARLRARGELAELRGDDLRFDVAETTVFFDHVMELRLNRSETELLVARTEGWVAGLQLAGLSLQGHPDPRPLIETLTGSNRYILDYLMEEVLHGQPPDVQEFLLKTSVLERLSDGLCAAVTGGAEAQRLLDSLEQANLFIQAQDDQRRWYRYHNLFLDLLRFQREKTYPGESAELHRRAAEWYQANRLPVDAVAHWLASGEITRAARLTAVTAEEWLGAGIANQLIGWLDSLPRALFQAAPRLHLVGSWASISLNYFANVEARLDEVEKSLVDPTADWQDHSVEETASELLATRAIVSFTSGDLQRAIDLSQRALAELPQGNILRASVWIGLGVAYRMGGDSEKAALAFTEAAEQSLQFGLNSMSISALANLADLRMDQGTLREAEQTYQKSLQLSSQATEELEPLAAQAYVGVAYIAYERNNLDAARDYLQRATVLANKWGNIDFQVIIPLRQAAYHLATGANGPAEVALNQAEALAAKNSASPMIQSVVDGFRLRFWVQTGRGEQAWEWIQSHPMQPYAPYVSLYQPECLARAEVQIAHARSVGDPAGLAQIDDLLSQMEPVLEAGGFGALANECGLLHAMQRFATGDRPSAFALLARLLASTQPEGYVRLFIERGELAHDLLRAYRDSQSANQGSPVVRAYLERLIDCFEAARGSSAAGTSAPVGRSRAHPDQLSEREIEVLYWAAQGLSNQEIADRLVLAPGTIKRHLHNIFEKLNVTSRVQAIARARELGLSQ